MGTDTLTSLRVALSQRKAFPMAFQIFRLASISLLAALGAAPGLIAQHRVSPALDVSLVRSSRVPPVHSPAFVSAQGTIAPTESLATGRYNQSAVLLPNGDVLIVGGMTTGPMNTNTCELFDAITSSFTTTGAMGSAPPYARNAPLAFLIADGRVVVGSGVAEPLEVYDVVKGQWRYTATSYRPYTVMNACALRDGRLLYYGTCITSLNATYTCTPINYYIYNGVTDRSQTGASINLGRDGARLTALPDGRVVVSGGGHWTIWQEGGSGYWRDDLIAEMQALDAANGSVTTLPSLLTPRTGASATLLPDGKLLIVGGVKCPCESSSTRFAPGEVLSSAEIFDPITGTLTYSQGSLPVPTADHTATLLPSGKVFIAGGRDATSNTVGGHNATATYVYDSSNDSFSYGPNVIVPRAGHSATLLEDGKVLIAGGQSTLQGEALSSAEIFTPAPLSPCQFVADTNTLNIMNEGNSSRLKVTTIGDCSWTATASDAWITFPSGNSRRASGDLEVSVARNSGPGTSRQGVITIGTLRIGVIQGNPKRRAVRH